MLNTLLLAVLLGQVQHVGTTYVPTTTYETTYTPTTTATTTYTPVYTYTLGGPQVSVQQVPPAAVQYTLPVQPGPAVLWGTPVLGLPLDPFYRPGLGGRGHIKYRSRVRW